MKYSQRQYDAILNAYEITKAKLDLVEKELADTIISRNNWRDMATDLNTKNR